MRERTLRLRFRLPFRMAETMDRAMESCRLIEVVHWRDSVFGGRGKNE